MIRFVPSSAGLRAILAAALVAAVAPAAFSRPAPAAHDTAARSTRIVLPSDVTPDAYRLEIQPDPAAMTFAGRVDIDVQVHRRTDRIVLNAVDLVIESARLGGGRSPVRISHDARVQTVTLVFGRPLAPGPHTLTLSYRGKIQDHGAGLFALKYATPDGERRALYTQFESANARSFLPCWDEPSSKATFQLTATLPAQELAVSNMPVEATEALPGGLQRVRFAPTPRMSSYLLFFAAGDFERVHRTVGNVDVGVVVKRGDLERAGYALDAAEQVLPFYDDYFGTPYPLPKLDLVAAPGQSEEFGAMENWGAILLFERYALVDDRVSTQSDRQGVYNVIAHEIAHQWFGNLVTMSWWDDIWLNEGFAQWMQAKATNRFHPEWKPWLASLAAKQRVMGTDARLGTHPVVVPIDDVLQASAVFDGITYTKGQQTIRTLEAYVGEDEFRDGVRRYMKRHAYGNTVSDDLWHAIDEGSARPIALTAHDLTLQAGVPLITQHASACVDGRTVLSLSQEHFAIDATSTAARLWHLPVTISSVQGPSVRVLLAGATPQSVSVPGCAPVILNAGQAAYARSRYSDVGFAALLASYPELSPEDQLGILNDTTSLALQGAVPMAAMMQLLTHVPPQGDPVLLAEVARQVADIDRLYDGLPTQAAWRAFARRLLEPMLAAVGPRRVPSESDNTAVLRSELLDALGQMDAPEILARAREVFDRYADDPDTPIDPELRKFALGTMAVHADAAVWDSLHRLARTAPTSVAREQLYEHLGESRDPALAHRALTLSLTDEPPKTLMAALISNVAIRHPERAFDFTVANWDRIQRRLQPGSTVWYVPWLVGHAPDATLVAKLERFAKRHIPANAQGDTLKAKANMLYRSRIREARLPQIDRWLEGDTKLQARK